MSTSELTFSTPPAWLRAAQNTTPAKRQPTFALYTLGCKVNQYDSHQIARILLARGFRRVEFRQSADLYVIDTCTVTNEADRKSRKAAARAQRNNPDALVAVTGCAASYSSAQFLRVVPDALVLPNARKWELPELAIERLQQRDAWHETYRELRQTDAIEPIPEATRERAVLKIQDGCNHNCSYCIIPSVRGASVLKSREQLMQEARTFVREGARELVVTGVSMGDWKSQSERSESRNQALCDLLRAVSQIEGLERVRVSSLDPADVDEDWLQCVARTDKVCPQIHLALQSGSASTLRRMRRRYTPQMFLKWARRWREIRPDGGLTTDVIVGFPGETDDEWQETLQVVREAKFSHIHVFPFSPRDDTHAATLPDPIDAATQKRRVAELIAIGDELSAQFAAQFIGTVQPILIEEIRDGVISGLTESYLRCYVEMDAASTCSVGDVVPVQVLAWRDGALQGSWARS